MITTKDVKIKEYDPTKPGKIISTNKTQPKEFMPKGKPQPKSDVRITTANVKELQSIRKEEMLQEKRAATIRQKKLNEEVKAYKEKKRLEEEIRRPHDGEPVYWDKNGKLFMKRGKERVYFNEKT